MISSIYKLERPSLSGLVAGINGVYLEAAVPHSELKNVMDKLQHVQNAATRLVTGTEKYERVCLAADA